MKTLYLNSNGAAGDRVIDLSIQSRNLAHELNRENPQSLKSPSLTQVEDVGEMLRTLHIPTVDPLAVEYSVTYRRTPSTQSGLADLHTFDDHWEEDSGGSAIVSTTWTCSGPHGICVESVELVKEVSRGIRSHLCTFLTASQDGVYAKVSECLLNTDNTDILTGNVTFGCNYSP